MKQRTQSNHRELLWVLAKTDFKLRYHGSVLGYLWSLLKPLLIFLILNFVFSNIFGPGIENYSLQLLTGIILWNFFAEGTTTGLVSLMSKASILTKAAVPKWIIITSATLNVLFTFILSLVVLSIFFIGYSVSPSITGIILFIGCALMTYGIIIIFSLITAPLYLKLRDLNQIWEVLLTAGFYATPIIYPIETIPEHLRFIMYLNPMTFIIEWSKDMLIEGIYPGYYKYSIALLSIALILFASRILFGFTSKRVAENI